MTDPDPATFGLAQIRQIALTVSDLARSIAFYRDALGLRFLFEAPPKMAFFDCAGVRLMIGEGERPGGSAIVYFAVEDVARAAAALESRGVVFRVAPALVARMPDHELWIGFFDDPDGNALALIGEVAT